MKIRKEKKIEISSQLAYWIIGCINGSKNKEFKSKENDKYVVYAKYNDKKDSTYTKIGISNINKNKIYQLEIGNKSFKNFKDLKYKIKREIKKIH